MVASPKLQTILMTCQFDLPVDLSIWCLSHLIILIVWLVCESNICPV
jgi:hypothetical protein